MVEGELPGLSFRVVGIHENGRVALHLHYEVRITTLLTFTVRPVKGKAKQPLNRKMHMIKNIFIIFHIDDALAASC